jgi:hypothetical protein
MSLNAVSFFNFKLASSSQGWTQQELAEFYRVEASLVRANIPIETDRGRSDEGDPWFVFCNANTGEIIVHFARFDGTYVVAGPALDGCARGRDFRALIEAQIASHPLVIPKPAGGGKVFIHPAALLIVLVATYFFKLSQTTAAAEVRDAPPAHPGVGPLDHSDSTSQAVMLDERATATLLAAIATGIAWAQSHDYNLWSLAVALPTKIDFSPQDLSFSTSSGVQSPVAGRDSLFYHDSPAAGTPLVGDIGGDPSKTSAGHRSLDSPNDHAVGQTLSTFETSMPAASQTLPTASGALSPTGSGALSHIGILPISGSTVSSGLPSTAPPIPAAEETLDVPELSVGAQTPLPVQGNPAQVQASLESPSLVDRKSVEGFVLREFQAAWGVVPNATQTDAWVARIIADPALETGGMSQALAGTPQFQAQYGVTGATIATAATVTALNEGILGLSPGPGALLNIGLPVWQVLQNFAQSAQFSNELASVSLTGPLKFVVSEIASGVAFNFSTDSDATNVESLNSTNNVTFLNLGLGANIEVSGAATATGTTVNSTYAMPTAPVSFQFDGGVKGVTIDNNTSGSAPTTETILSTGAANGSPANANFVTASAGQHTVGSLTIDATASLVTGLDNDDFSSNATLTVLGAAALVDLTPSSTDPPFSTVSASGLANGALHIEASSALISFTGGGGGGNELLYCGTDISGSATTIDGGSGSGNILSAQLVNVSNAAIFTDWQIVDITNFGGDPFSTTMLTNDTITGVQLGHETNPGTVETVLNLTPVATVTVTGTGFTDAGLTVTHSSATRDSLALTLHNTDSDTALRKLTLTALTSTGDAAISIDSTGAAGSAPAGGYNGIGTLTETDGHLTTVTVTGNNYTYVGIAGGVNTDAATTTASITSALAKIDASATTGGVAIYAGNTTLDGSGFEVSYNGLMIQGGSGNRDVLYNGANVGVTLGGNGDSDTIWLGGSGAIGILGTGASDVAYVGSSGYATALTPGGPEIAGAALGDTATFGAGATATLKIYEGGKWDGATYVGGNPGNGIGETIVVGAVPGLKIDLSGIFGASETVHNQQTSTAGAPNLTTAENDAVAALGTAGVAYFTFGGNEYLVAAHATEAGVSLGDAVVQLHAVTFTGLSMRDGVVHVA